MIRLAILGAGIGASHLAGYRVLPNRYSVKYLCDLDSGRASEATEHDPAIKVITDLEEALSDPEIDLIDICLPPHLHVPVSLRALEAGKHVICEKPIARSIHEVDQIEAALDHSTGQLFPVFQYRYGTGFAQLRALIDTGLAGKPFAASSETHWNRQADYYCIPWRGTWDGEAGGAVLGHAIHAHDLLCHFLGPVAEVSAFLGTGVNDIEVDDCAAISMRMESGAVATSSVTLGAAVNTSRLRFCFEGLTAESGTLPYAPVEDQWTFIARGQVRQEEIDDVLAGVTNPLPGFAGFLYAVAEALNGRQGNEVTFEDGRRSIEMVSAIYQSARTGQSVKLPIGKEAKFRNGWMPTSSMTASSSTTTRE